LSLQIELYNQMVEKEGTDGEEEARKAFYHATEPTHKQDGEQDDKSRSDAISSALIERVIRTSATSLYYSHLITVRIIM
jgi:LETM1 and EF-hand domain-containing protein 1